MTLTRARVLPLAKNIQCQYPSTLVELEELRSRPVGHNRLAAVHSRLVVRNQELQEGVCRIDLGVLVEELHNLPEGHRIGLEGELRMLHPVGHHSRQVVR